MLEDQNPVASNQQLPYGNNMPTCVVEALRTGFIDTGIIVKVKIPYIANVHRKMNRAYNFQNPAIPASNRQPLFGILIDPYINHDLSGSFSPVVYPDDSWATNNLDITMHPYGQEHPLVRMAPTFMGWRGSLNYMVTINSSMIVQGELSFIRAKYMANGPYKWKYPQLEFDEVDNNQIINLAQEKRVVKSVCYSENVNFINMMHYWQSIANTTIKNNKPTHFPRNYLFVRPNTDLTTLSTSEGYLTFKIFIEPGPDFEFIFPSIPLALDMFRDLSVVDKRFPFVAKAQIVVAQRFYAGVREMTLDDDFANITLPISAAFVAQRTLIPGSGWIDVKKYVPNAVPQWTQIFAYELGRTAPGSTTFAVGFVTNLASPAVILYTKLMTDMLTDEVVLEFGYNFGNYASVQPPYFYP